MPSLGISEGGIVNIDGETMKDESWVAHLSVAATSGLT